MIANKKWFFVVFAVVAFCWANLASAATIYVSQEEGVGDYETIQDAINAAHDGDIVLVADGTYTGENNTDLSWNGNEKHITVKSENGPDSCIIDCDGEGRGFSFEESNQNESDVIDGFTIKNGGAEYGGGISCDEASPTITNCTFIDNEAWYSGGIDCYSSSPTITNCTFTDNVAWIGFEGEGDDDGGGGGIGCYEDSSPTITDCTFTENGTYCAGGGIFCGYSSSPTITDCTFTENGAYWDGGGIACWDESSPSITDCTFTGNIGWYGGGIECAYSSPTITNCTIKGNFGGEDEGSGGGGIFCYNSFPTIASCTIKENGGFFGGGVAAMFGDMMDMGRSGVPDGNNFSITITDCTIAGNEGFLGGGIAIFDNLMALIDGRDPEEISFSKTINNCTIKENSGVLGGGIAIFDNLMALIDSRVSDEFSFSTTITNCTIAENYADELGGGVYVGEIFDEMGRFRSEIPYEDFFPTITNCTIAENEAEGICCENSFLTVKNSILWDNGFNGERTDGGEDGEEIALYGSFLTISYSDVEGEEAGVFVEESILDWDDDSNIEEDPLFVKAAHNIADIEDGENIGYHLSKNSPCRDSGTNEGAPNNDIDGQKRPFNEIVDMGSDEYVWSGSLTSGDGQVNLYLGEGAFTEFETVNEEDLPDEGKPELTFSFGFSSFRIVDIEEGGIVNIVLTCSKNVPTNAEYWKYDENREKWYQLPFGSNDGDKVIILTLTDGGDGDSDGVANGVIVDPGGIGWENSESGDDGQCFIENILGFAKASSEEIMIVRRFRDENLLTNPVGCLFVSAYYKTSPVLVGIIREYPILRSTAREILKPLIWLAKSFEN